MSALHDSQPGTAPDRRRRLRPVPTRRPPVSRVPFLLILGAVLALGMVGNLVLQTTLQEQAFQVRSLQKQATALSYQRSLLQSQIDEVSTAAGIAEKAKALGMAPNPYTTYVDQATGKVSGVNKPVTGSELPQVTYKTEQQIAEQRAAAVAAPVTAPSADAVAGDSVAADETQADPAAIAAAQATEAQAAQEAAAQAAQAETQAAAAQASQAEAQTQAAGAQASQTGASQTGADQTGADQTQGTNP